MSPTRTEPLSITRLDRVTADADRDNLIDFYTEQFTEVSERAVQQHLMPTDELEEILLDVRVHKYVASAAGRIVGLSVMTGDLAAWPLIAPAYFRRAYPGRKIFYIGFVTAERGQSGVFPGLIRTMYPEVIAEKGVAVMDFCGVNVDIRRLPKATDLLLKSINPAATGRMIDRQEFWAWEFPEADRP